MNAQRKLIAYALALVVVGAHAYCFVVRKDVWPFSHYEMYAGVRGNSWTHLELTGIATNDARDDVKLPAEGVHPPRNIRVMTGIGKLVRISEEDPVHRPKLDRALQGVAGLYNRQLRAQDGAFTGIQGVRLYRQKWVRETGPDGNTWKMVSREKIAESLLGGSS